MRRLQEQCKYKVPAFRLCLVRERRRSRKLIAIRSPKDAVDLLAPLRSASEEHFVTLHLNAKNEVIGLHEVSHGTLSESLVHPREVYKAALMANSYAILVCHNHPSGAELVPSKEDYATTSTLVNVGKLIGVGLIDHLIVGPQGDDEDLSKTVFSFREQHPEIWRD